MLWCGPFNFLNGLLGKANEVDMKNEILEDMGKREILQNTEHEEHKEETEEQEVQPLHAAEKMAEEHDALSTVMLPDSRFTEPIQSLTEHVSGSTSSSDDSDTDDLRKETKSTCTTVQQPVSMEAEQCDLNASTAQNSEVGSLQGHQGFETPQEICSGLGTEHELGKAAPEQGEQEDLKTSHALSDNEMDQETNVTSESCELVSNQAGPPEAVVAGSLREEVDVKGHVEGLQHSEESAENKGTDVSEEELVESKDCTDGRIDETECDRAEKENKVRNTVQGQTRETGSVGLEEMESCESDVPADKSEKEGRGDQAHIQPVSSEDRPSVSSEQNEQDKTELENATAEKAEHKEVLIEELEMSSDCAETGEQDKAAVEAAGCIAEVKGSVLQQTMPDTGLVNEVTPWETSLDPRVLDDKNEESELESGEESRKGKENRTEQEEELMPKVEVQLVQCSEETTDEAVGEKNTPLEGKAQDVVKQQEPESQESSVDVSVTTEDKADKEILKENEQELELASHYCGRGFASEGGANNSLAQKVEQDENINEQVQLEGPTEESLEDDGDAFDFDEESKQVLETDSQCDGGKADTQKGGRDGANGAVGKTAQTDESGGRTDKIETKDALTEDDSLQHKERDEPEETGHLQGGASWKTDENTDVMEDEIKASDSNKVEQIPDKSLLEEDLESAGNKRDESKEDLQGSRKGRGKSREDCTVS